MEQRHQCYYCDVVMHFDVATFDHIVPKSKGGRLSWDNCVLACSQCNGQKASMDVATFLFIKRRAISKDIRADELTGKNLVRLVIEWIKLRVNPHKR